MSHAVIAMVDTRPGASAGSTYAPRIHLGPVAWLPWSVARPMATDAGEREFVSALAARSNGVRSPHTRSDVTAVVNSLRGGVSIDQLLCSCPGLEPSQLFGAYHALEDARSRAAAAWCAIAHEPTESALAKHGDTAAALVPVPVNRLREAAVVDPAMLPRVAAHLVADIALVRRFIQDVEQKIDRCTDEERAIADSRRLYDPTADSIFARADHLPDRVGSLVPSRVAALLGERGLFLPPRTDR